jgi:hypothetical protein
LLNTAARANGGVPLITSRLQSFGHIKRHIDDHIFLPTDHAATAQLDKNFSSVDPVILAVLFRMAQK